MKIRYLVFLFLFLLFGGLMAQPANDDCSTAQAIGSLPTPANCPNGSGSSLNISGTLTGATAANPYTYMPNCSGSATTMATNVNDVWYTFVATGYQLNVVVSGTVVNPNIAMYSGTCGSLGGGIGGCAIGTAGGGATLTVNQMVPGTTYYLQVSANSAGAGGNFNLQISNSIDCNNCLISSTLTVNPPPINGAYAPGTTVNFCYQVAEYTQINTNWLHGVQIAFGSGWNISTVTANPPPACASGTGTWIYYPNGITDAQGNTWPGGFYFDSNLGGALDGNAGNNFGDNCSGSISNSDWNFCFSITTAAACNPGANLSVTINTSGDGESGSWTNNGCTGDAATVFNAVTSCCPPTMTQTPASCAGNDGTATATPVGSAAPYDYVWTGPSGYSNTQSSLPGASVISSLVPGTYTVAVTDNNNCLITNTITVTGGGISPVPVASYNNPVCEGETINLSCNTISGATYSWSGPNGFTSAQQNPSINNATSADAGVYTVTVTVTGCSAVSSTTVIINPLPVASASNDGPYCAGETINLYSLPSGATSFSWIGPSAFSSSNQNPSITNSTTAMSGTYTVTVFDGTCSATATTGVTINALPNATAASNSPVCLNQTINLNGGGGVTYAWSGPNSFSSASQNPVITPASTANAGTYSLTVTDANSCINTATTTVIVNPLPSVTAGNNGPLCAGLTLNFSSTSGMISYSWSGPNNFSSNLQNPSIASVGSSNAGTYTVTVVDANGCVNAALTIVTLNGPITVSASGLTPVCENDSINLNAIGAVTYNWQGPSGFTSTQQNPVIATAAASNAGTYTVTGTDAAGCTGVDSFTIVVNPLPLPTAFNNGPLCAGSTLNLNGGGGNTFSWSGPNNFSSTVQNPPIVNVTTAATGTYTLTVTNNFGCTASATTTVTINPTPVASLTASSPACNNSTILLTANGGISYQWTGPDNFSSTLQNPSIPNATQSASGTYSCVVTGVGSCTVLATVAVTLYPPVAVVASQDVTICAGQTATLSSVASGGDGNYNYLWTPGGSTSGTATVSPTTTTTYSIGVNNCGESVQDDVIVFVNPAPAITITPDITSGCEPLCVNFTGTSVPASVDCDWQFSNGVNVNNDCDTLICFSDSGIYGATLTVTDINGCSNTLDVPSMVIVYPVPVADFIASPQPVDIFDPHISFTDVSYNAVIGDWHWNFGDPLSSISTNQNPDFSYDNPGTYTVELIVTSVNGCIDTTWNTVVVDPNFSIYVPNAFTPNGDNINEDFFAKGEGIDEKHWNMWIFDRWGNMIWYSKDFHQHWDGKVQGGESNDLVQIDVYVWKIICRNYRGETFHFVGHVSVVR